MPSWGLSSAAPVASAHEAASEPPLCAVAAQSAIFQLKAALLALVQMSPLFHNNSSPSNRPTRNSSSLTLNSNDPSSKNLIACSLPSLYLMVSLPMVAAKCGFPRCSQWPVYPFPASRLAPLDRLLRISFVHRLGVGSPQRSSVRSNVTESEDKGPLLDDCPARHNAEADVAKVLSLAASSISCTPLLFVGMTPRRSAPETARPIVVDGATLPDPFGDPIKSSSTLKSLQVLLLMSVGFRLPSTEFFRRQQKNAKQEKVQSTHAATPTMRST
mmetsp:Transcript_104138/g.301249  ORF Transcript_104138/g.301249 Transcript_104138/m.301249 type:complete len:272 (+) Transcript_104138:398-1213(+)